MTSKTGTQPEPQKPAAQSEADKTNLTLCYGAIGISSVAAAVRYAGGAKNPAYAPVVHRNDDRFADAAA